MFTIYFAYEIAEKEIKNSALVKAIDAVLIIYFFSVGFKRWISKTLCEFSKKKLMYIKARLCF